MKQVAFCLMVIFSLSASACSGNKAPELLQTAQFEEVQNNKEHAAKLYEEIVSRFPDSTEAKKAKERLKAIREGK